MKRVNIGFLIVLLILIIFSYFYVTIYSKYDVMLYLNDYKEIIQLNHIIEVLLLITITFFIYKIFFFICLFIFFKIIFISFKRMHISSRCLNRLYNNKYCLHILHLK